MKFATTVTNEMYTEYLQYKFKKSSLPVFLEVPYKYLHHLKNSVQKYTYPREYTYEINEDGISKSISNEEQHYSWDMFNSYEKDTVNLALINKGNVILYIYIGKNFDEVFETCRKYLD